MPAIHVGASLPQMPAAAYSSQLGFAELRLQSPLPRANVLKKWGANLQDGFKLALYAPPSFLENAQRGVVTESQIEEASAWLANAARELGAALIVVGTPAALTPGARGQQRLFRLFHTLRKHGAEKLVWSPEGLWEHEELPPLCEKLRIAGSYDPLLEQSPCGDFAYARIPEGLGARQRLSPFMIEEIASSLMRLPSARESFAVFVGPKAPRRATQLDTLLQSGGD